MIRNKILINGRFLTSPQTGVQRTAAELIKALDRLIDEGKIDKDKFQFEIIHPGKEQRVLKLRHVKITRRGILNGNLWEQFELPLYSFGKPLVNLCSIAPLLKKKQIVFVHDVSFKVNKSFFSKSFQLWYGFAIPWITKLADAVVTVSKFSKNELINQLSVNPNKIKIIYNSAEHILNLADPAADFMERINSQKPYCLAVSSLGANKNFNGLLEALKKINFGKHRMLIAGGGVSALKSETKIVGSTYLGYVSDEELKYLYSNAELFIFPSFYEGFGIPPLEAMICGCPVIASNTSSIPEVLEDGASYFSPFDTDKMGKAIEELLSNPTRRAELTASGYQQVAKYNWLNSASQFLELLDECYGK